MIGKSAMFNICSICPTHLPTEALRFPRIPVICALAVCALATVGATPGHAAWLETKPPIRIVVPSAPGGGADVLSRLLADQVGSVEDVKIVVENRAGADNMIGTEIASRPAPDGNTLLINTLEFVINAHLRKLTYNPLIDVEPIAIWCARRNS